MSAEARPTNGVSDSSASALSAVTKTEELSNHGGDRAGTPDAGLSEDQTNDSEAETEILPGSKPQTPLKLTSKRALDKDRKDEQEADVSATGRTGASGGKENGSAARGRHSRQNSHAGTKRKAQEAAVTRSTRSNAGSPGSPVKRARLSPGHLSPRGTAHDDDDFETDKRRKVNSRNFSDKQSPRESDEEGVHPGNSRETSDEDPALASSQQSPASKTTSNHEIAVPAAQTTSSLDGSITGRLSSAANVPRPPQSAPLHRKSSAEVASYVDSVSHRAATQEPRTRSESPHHFHQRSSSLQSSLLLNNPPGVNGNQESNRRLRSRNPTQTPTLASSSLRDSIDQRHSTPAQSPTSAGHMAHRKDVDGNGATPLARACERGDEETVKRILDESLDDLERPDNSLNRPLQKAALEGHIGVVKMLIDVGCQLDVANEPDHCHAETPLIDAIENGHVEIVKMLLDAGANPWKKSALYKMPMDCLDSSKMATDIKEEIRDLLNESATRHLADSKDPCQADHLPATLATKDLSRLNQIYDIKLMERMCLQGDFPAVAALERDYKVTPTLKCAIAAARGGHLKVLQKVYELAPHLKIDPPHSRGEDTPILAAIGRGNIDVVKYIIMQPEFDINRQIDGKSYPEIAAAKLGPKMRLEMRILNGIPEEPSQESEAEAEVPAEKDSTPSETTPHDDPELSSAATARAGSESSKKRRLITRDERDEHERIRLEEVQQRELEEKAERERIRRVEYLERLPHALARALTPEGHLAGHKDQLPEAERLWRKTLSYWTPLVIFERGEIELNCPIGTEKQTFTLNIFAAIFCHHEDLTTCKTIPGMETLPATFEHRKKLWRETTLKSDFLMDHHWQNAPREELEKSGFDFKEMGKGVSLRVADRANVVMEKFFALPEEEFFFIDLETFIRHTARLPWLRDVRIATETSVHFAGDHMEDTPAPAFKNGQMILEHDPDMTK